MQICAMFRKFLAGLCIDEEEKQSSLGVRGWINRFVVLQQKTEQNYIYLQIP